MCVLIIQLVCGVCHLSLFQSIVFVFLTADNVTGQNVV